MAKGKRGNLYDDDDYDDGYDDDDHGDYEEYEEQQPAPKAGATGSGKQVAVGGQASSSSARASGASRLAQSLCDPPPPRPDGRPQRGAKPDPVAQQLQQPAYPLVPPRQQQQQQQPGAAQAAAAAAAAAAPAAAKAQQPAAPRPAFAFDTPSPDDLVRAAQEGRAGAIGPPSSSSSAPSSVPVLPQSRALMGLGAHQPGGAAARGASSSGSAAAAPAAGSAGTAASGSGSGAAAASAAMASLALAPAAGRQGGSSGVGAEAAPAAAAAAAAAARDGQQAAGGAAASALSSRRDVSEYVMEADLARQVAAAAQAEAPGAGAGAGGAKPGLHLVVLGHVDAGKSSLMGRLLHELGYVSAKDAHRNQRDAAAAGKGSFAWAWVLDERPEERQRGVTVDVAMTRFETPRYRVTLLDAPGHRDFVPNMIQGAAQADAALLLVDGSPGGFEAGFCEPGQGLGAAGGGQTREHAALARSLGVEQMAVVVSKLDTGGYQQARFEAIKCALLPFLRQCGFREQALQWLPAVAVGDAPENLTHQPTDPRLLSWWRDGPTLVAAIDAFSPNAHRERAAARPLRMPITDAFKSKTGAVVLGGKLEGGALQVGSRVLLVPPPAGQAGPLAVRSLEVGGAAAALARAGDSVEVVLGPGPGGPLDPGSVPPGAVLCHPDFPALPVTRFEARLLVMDVAVPLLRGATVSLHAHTAREEAHITQLLATLDPKTGEVLRARPRCLAKGQTALAEVTACRPVVLEAYGDYRGLGRVALRDGGRTLAVGIVTRLLQ